ncbi:MAG: hypothetical protein AAF229_09715 [Pseudomonadota bacterium]
MSQDDWPNGEYFSWFENQEKFATVSGVTKEDRLATRMSQAIPPETQTVRLRIATSGPGDLGDFPTTGIRFPKILSERAFTLLRPMLLANGLTRDADIGGERYHLFWPTSVSDCLDYEASKIKRAPTGYERLLVPAFQVGGVESRSVFVTRQFPDLVFVGREFLSIITENGLKGFCTWPDMGDDESLICV